MIDDLKPQKKKPHTKTRAERIKWWKARVLAQQYDDMVEDAYEKQCSMRWEMGDR